MGEMLCIILVFISILLLLVFWGSELVDEIWKKRVLITNVLSFENFCGK